MMNRITENEFLTHIEDHDFFRRYGNPVIITRKGGADLVCMAWEYYERLMSVVSKDAIADGAMASFAVT